MLNFLAENYINFILLFVCITLSAIFSCSETALFSLSRARLLSYKSDASKQRQAIVKLMKTYQFTLIGIVFGNILVNTGLTLSNDAIFASFKNFSPILQKVITISFSVVVLLIFGEIAPKTIALIYAEPISEKIALPILYLRKLLFPIIWVTDKFFNIILNLIGRKTHEALTPEEYSSYLEMSASVGAFTRKELALLESAFQLREITAEEIMTCRIDLVNVNKTMSPEEVGKIIREEKREFYPVINKDIDDTECLLSAKKFFLNSVDERQAWDKTCSFNTEFIPANSNLTLALNTMRSKNISAALVVDEYGRTTGLISLKEIYAQLTGDVETVYNQPEYSIEKTDKNEWLVQGMMPLFALEETLKIEIPEEFESSTVNGLFCELAGKIPVAGDEANVDGIIMHAEAISRRRVIKIRVKKLPHQPPVEASEGTA
ncbi:MAG: HlyC/CorC family transporter [Lentisphaerae bacterium]|nr:HlyC/CorC family transporter [Lentisphaerota bacterium]MCP4101788.1 HlyC/CorC family transporter [Lentisphaerota bacterium]